MNIKKLTSGLLIASLLSAIFSMQTFAIEANNSFELSISSQKGNLVTVDLNVINSSNQQITSVQSWLEFDTTKLKGIGIDTTGTPFDFVVPGESTFDGNIVKIGRSTLSGKTSGSKVFVAKITFQILKSGGEIKFYDYKTGNGGHVSIQVFDNGFPVNTLEGKPKSLKITGSTTPTPSVPTIPATPIVDTNTDTSDENIILDRPSDIYLDTSIGSVSLKWNSVIGAKKYYVYYGQTSGRYLNRRMIGDVNNYDIDSLESGKRYYFAITAIGNNGKESDYSDEVSVIIGNPSTSTSIYIKQKTQNSGGININNNVNNNQNNNNVIKNKTIDNNQNISQKFNKNTETGPAEIAFIALFVAMMSAYGIKRFNGVKLHI